MKKIYDRALAGAYRVALPFPTRPNKPAILSLTVSSLSREDIASLPDIIADYEAKQVNYLKARDAYYAEESKLHNQFRADLEAEFGMVGHPKADILFAKAWDRGHSGGFGDVVQAYIDLHELVS